MGNYSWMVPTTIGVIIGISFIALIGQLIVDHLQAQRDRLYKTKEDHIILNSSSRDEWMSGQLIKEDEVKLNRFSSFVAPIAQIITVALFAIIVIVWNGTLVSSNARLAERVSELELQLHAIALSPAGNNNNAAVQNDFPLPPDSTARGTPMQQACANLIGRVADAYEKAESSKIGQSLESLVQKLGCLNTLAK